VPRYPMLPHKAAGVPINWYLLVNFS